MHCATGWIPRRRLVLMSNARVRYLSDEDTQAVIAYLRSQPAIENETQGPAGPG